MLYYPLLVGYMMDPVLFTAVSAMVCWGIADFCIQRSARAVGNIEVLFWICAVSTIGLLPFVWGDLAQLTTRTGIGLILLLTIITLAAALLEFEALRVGKLSVIDMVLTLEIPFTIALGLLFFHESFTVWQAVLTLLLMWGVAMIALSPGGWQANWRAHLEKGVFLAIIGALVMGFVNFFTAVAARELSPMMAIWAPGVLLTAICVGIIWRRNGYKRLVRNIRKHTGLILLMSVVDTAAWVFYAYALVDGELAIITAITESYPAIAVILGVWLNREHLRGHQYVGIVMALGASVVLALTL
jgi:uncharacterized membrane protein